MPSFTVSLPDLEQVGPIVEAHIGVGAAFEDVLRQHGETVPTPVSVRALIDTGASATVIQDDIPKQLGLHPVGTATITTPSSTNVPCLRYDVRLLLPNKVGVHTIAIAVPLRGQNIQCLIGRDVLHNAVLIYNGYAETFTLSF